MKKIFALALSLLLFCHIAYAKTLSYIPDSPTNALIMIHGFGGDGGRVSWMTNSLRQILPHTAFYYPTAPDHAPNGGYQWFVIPKLGEEIKEKTLYDMMMADAIKNVSKLHELVDEIHDKHHISYQNIYVAGFSQGGLMALLTTLTNPHHLSKAISFSGVPLLLTPDFTHISVKAKPELLLMQGNNDKVIPEDSLNMTEKTLQIFGIFPEIHIISGLSHQINQEELQYMINFLKEKN